MTVSITGLFQAINHDYTVWIAGSIVLLFGLYWVSTVESLMTDRQVWLTALVVDIDRYP